MALLVPCPGCHARLSVPESAIGRSARCPQCKTKFIVPQPKELLDDTVCAWLAQDQGEREAEPLASAGAAAPAVRTEAAAAPPARATPVVVPPAVQAPPPRPVAKAPAAAPSRPAPPAAAPAVPPPPTAPAPAADAGAQRVRPLDLPPANFPTELVITGPRPHLVVVEASQSGVRLAFDHVWLEHTGFRCSMPLRGVFGGSTQRDQLRFRPLVFVDRSGATIRSAQEIEARFEQQLLANWTLRDVLNAMGLIEGLPRPFCYPVPYFVDAQHSNLSVHCVTHTRPDGGITCEVTIPHHACALEWLRNVNGVSGPEYELLEREVAALHSDNWSSLPETVRMRLGAWCRFHLRERFVTYISDADFGARDAGLAGLVVTDQRIIYHKFHHGGQIDLNEAGTLVLRAQDNLVHASYENWQIPGHRLKLVKLHPGDVPTLAAALQHATALKVQGPG